MKKKIIGIVVIICILFVIGIICLKALLYGGYNAQGVSKYLCIAIDESILEKQGAIKYIHTIYQNCIL